MRPTTAIVALALLLPFPAPLLSQSGPALRCTFGAGSMVEWRGDKPTVEVENWGGPPVLITDLDVEAGTAILSGGAGYAIVAVQPVPGAIHIVERTPSGTVNLLTVYGAADSGNYPASYSRHIVSSFADRPIVSQYHGRCERVS